LSIFEPVFEFRLLIEKTCNFGLNLAFDLLDFSIIHKKGKETAKTVRLPEIDE